MIIKPPPDQVTCVMALKTQFHHEVVIDATNSPPPALVFRFQHKLFSNVIDMLFPSYPIRIQGKLCVPIEYLCFPLHLVFIKQLL